jgi:hypothetical protein
MDAVLDRGGEAMRGSLATLSVLLLLLVLTEPALADPVNKNTDTTDLHCDAPIGDITITAVLHSAGLPLLAVDAPIALVIRDSRITVLSTGEVLQFSLAPGIDRARLVTCTFTETFPGLGEVVGEIRVQVAPGP